MLIYNDKEIILSDNTYVNDHIIIKDIKPPKIELKRKVIYKCDICDCEYTTGNSIRSNCRKICRKHHSYYKCDYCHKEFEILYLSDFINSNKKERFCSHNCALQFRNRSKEQINAVIEMNKNRVKNNLSKKQICKYCNKEFYSIFPMDKCNACITSQTNKNNFKIKQICKKCGKTFNSTFIMDLALVAIQILEEFLIL